MQLYQGFAHFRLSPSMRDNSVGIQRNFRWIPKSNYYDVPILVTYSATYGSKSSRPTKTIRCRHETVIGQFVDTLPEQFSHSLLQNKFFFIQHRIAELCSNPIARDQVS